MIISPGARDPKVAINSANFNMASGRVVSRGRTGLGDEDDTLQFETSDGIVVVPAFDKMGLREELVRGIYAYGEPISRLDSSRGDAHSRQASKNRRRFNSAP